MVLGYDKKRPSKADYLGFIDYLVSELKRSDIEELSFIVHGSILRDDCVFGESDIDGLFIFGDDIIIEKEKFKELSKIVAKALEVYSHDFQVSVADLATMRDGRFNCFDPHFEQHFENSQACFGPDYRSQFRYEIAGLTGQSVFRWNLRNVRQSLLFSEYYQNTDYKKFVKKFREAMQKTIAAPNSAGCMIEGSYPYGKSEPLENRLFSQIDNSVVQEWRALRKIENLDKMSALYCQPEMMLDYLTRAVTFFEELIKAYIEEYPTGEN
ncbi:hypothetical protein GOV04_05505 [Candidatus Woesearchaeota archaeon]|nr:hypothetical protein [Candidatus Woesearchaeota archaeon]